MRLESCRYRFIFRIQVPDTDNGSGFQIPVSNTDSTYGIQIRNPDTDSKHRFQIRIPDTNSITDTNTYKIWQSSSDWCDKLRVRWLLVNLRVFPMVCQCVPMQLGCVQGGRKGWHYTNPLGFGERWLIDGIRDGEFGALKLVDEGLRHYVFVKKVWLIPTFFETLPTSVCLPCYSC